ncbi:MAG: succinate dehydrogenase, cytochrome b556 subunit [Candidatus Eisenbacteria bacterium]
MRYRWHLGYVAWILNRVSGLAITFYLVIHIWVIHHLSKGPEGFEKVMGMVQTPLFKLGEIALLGAILYHAMNGIRVLLVEWGQGYLVQRRLFWYVMAAGVVLFVFGAYPILISAMSGGVRQIGEVVR